MVLQDKHGCTGLITICEDWSQANNKTNLKKQNKDLKDKELKSFRGMWQ